MADTGKCQRTSLNAAHVRSAYCGPSARKYLYALASSFSSSFAAPGFPRSVVRSRENDAFALPNSFSQGGTAAFAVGEGVALSAGLTFVGEF